MGPWEVAPVGGAVAVRGTGNPAQVEPCWVMGAESEAPRGADTRAAVRVGARRRLGFTENLGM